MSRNNNEKRAMDAWAEDFIFEVSQKALSNAKNVLSRLVNSLLASEDFSDVVRDKVMRIVDEKLGEEAEKAISKAVEEAIERIGRERQRALGSLRSESKAVNTAELVASVKTLSSEVLKLKEEVVRLKQQRPTSAPAEGGSKERTIQNHGMINGNVIGETVHIYGNGMINGGIKATNLYRH